MAIVVSLINMKGGVGKTTLAAQLAHASDRKEFRTLAVDLDPQANLSQSLFTPEKYVKYLKDKKPTIVQIFDEYFPANDEYSSPKPLDVHQVIVKKAGYWARSTLDLIPSRLELSRTLKNPYGKERRLAKALSKISDDYDLIIIDCAPTESILTDAAYFASRYILVPVKPEFLATIGLPLLARSVKEFKGENNDHELDMCGIVFNHSSTYYEGPEGVESIKEVKAEAIKNEWHIFETQVRYSGSYPRAARAGTPIVSTSHAQTPVKAEFNKFVDEFFARINLHKG